MSIDFTEHGFRPSPFWEQFHDWISPAGNVLSEAEVARIVALRAPVLALLPNTDLIVTVQLTNEQMVHALDVARRRTARNRSIGSQHKYGFKGKGEKIDEEGAIGEKAVAVWSGLEWSFTAKDFNGADVGGVYHVRSTPHRDGNLLMHKEDLKDPRPFILARVGAAPLVELVGWLPGTECDRQEYWEAGKRKFPNRPCYLIPWQKLRVMKDIPAPTKPASPQPAAALISQQPR